MKTVSFTMTGESPISFGRYIQSKKNTGESHDAFEQRTWKERCHIDKNGIVFIPAMAVKNMLADCAKFLSETVPGKGKATYTKHFEAGLMVVDSLPLGVHIDDVEGETLPVPSDGKKGGGSRVLKTFPIIRDWKARATVIVLDPLLIDKPDVIKRYAEHAGKFIGIGRWRPRNGGLNGRFSVSEFQVGEVK